MDFARTQLTKYGWEEGRGLGKEETGITQALKPKLKFDKAGIGHDCAETFTHRWWERTFDAAAKNINVCQTEDGVSLTAEDDFEITTGGVSSKRRKDLFLNNFTKGATLTNDGTVEVAGDPEDLGTTENVSVIQGSTLTDEELFRACGGRTAHIAARHGLGFHGKLARVEAQEKQILTNSTLPKVVARTERKEKKGKSKRKSKDTVAEHVTSSDDITSENVESSEFKKRKKIPIFENVTRLTYGEEDAVIDVEQFEPRHKKRKQKMPGETCLDVVKADNIVETNNQKVEQTDVSTRKSKKSKKTEETLSENVETLDEDQKIEQTDVSTHKRKKSKKAQGSLSEDVETLEQTDVSNRKSKKSKRTDESLSEHVESLDVGNDKNAKKKSKKTDNDLPPEDSGKLDELDGPIQKSKKHRKERDVTISSSEKAHEDTVVDEPVDEGEPSSKRSKKKKKPSTTQDDAQINCTNTVSIDDLSNQDLGNEIVSKKAKKSKEKKLRLKE